MEPARTALLVMDVQEGIVERLVLLDKMFPRQARVATVAEWAADLAA